MIIEDDTCKCDCHITGIPHTFPLSDGTLHIRQCCYKCTECDAFIDMEYSMKHIERCAFNDEDRKQFGVKLPS